MEDFDKLLEKAIELLDSSDLDDEVHEAKSLEASGINNQGIDVQLEYLEEALGKEEMKKLLEELLEGEF